MPTTPGPGPANTGATVLVVDDEPDLRENLREWLSLSGFVALGAASASEALTVIKQQRVEVVLTDLKMPRLNGLDLLTLIKEFDPAIEVIIMTGYGTLDDAVQALRHGNAFDFLQKPLRDLHKLNVVIEKALLRQHLQARPAPSSAAPSQAPAFAQALTQREGEIMALVARGLDNRQIAKTLFIGEGTVRNQLSLIYSKLGVTNRTQAAMIWRQHWQGR